MTPEEDIVRKRQQDRARIMAWMLGACVVHLLLITIATTRIGT